MSFRKGNPYRGWTGGHMANTSQKEKGRVKQENRKLGDGIGKSHTALALNSGATPNAPSG